MRLQSEYTMSNLLDLSAKIDALSLALFETLSEAAGSLGTPFFVVGATARDLIFGLGHGLPSSRATLDKDFGVRVASWGEFERLKRLLLTNGLFKRTKQVQRLLFRDELLGAGADSGLWSLRSREARRVRMGPPVQAPSTPERWVC